MTTHDWDKEDVRRLMSVLDDHETYKFLGDDDHQLLIKMLDFLDLLLTETDIVRRRMIQ